MAAIASKPPPLALPVHDPDSTAGADRSPSAAAAGDGSTAAASPDFGSPETLAQIRALTDVGAMTRFLHECVAYQRSLDLRLEVLLSQRPELDRNLASLSRSSHFLDAARSEAAALLSSVRSTSDLAESVSRKVRDLDVAQSRVKSSLSRIDAVVQRSHFLDSARRALAADDLESAAMAVRSFLDLDAQFHDSGSDQRDQLLESKRQLEAVVRQRLAAAVDKQDDPSVLRYVRIFPPLGLQEEGLQIYVAYLRKAVALRSRLEFEHLAEVAGQSPPQSPQVDFVGCLTSLFKDLVLAVVKNDEVLRGLCGEDGVVYAICELHEECDSKGTQILKKFSDHRKLARLSSEIHSYSKNLLAVGSADAPDPREVEMYMEEILSLNQLGEEYTEFMLSKIRGLCSIDPDVGPRATEAFRSRSFSRMLQELSGFYVIFEEFFMVENVRKAIKIDEHVPDSHTTSMVDDVFYVLQSCCKRAISTASFNSVLPVLNGAMNLLSHEYQEALQQKMREPNLGTKLFLGGVGVQKTGTEIATALNNMDVSSEYVLKLKHEIDEWCSEVFTMPADREKVKSCLSELGEISTAFKQILNAGMEQLVGSVAPRIRPVLDGVGTVNYDLSDAEYEENEVNDPWVQKLLLAVEASTVWLRPAMTTSNYDSLIHLVIDFVVKRLEVIMMQKRFSQLGGLQLDREVRALVNHFSEATQRPVRDKFARLTQITTILNLERVSEILDFWGENAGHMTWLLTPSDVRRVLGLRIDFKLEAIAALRL